MNDRLLSLIKRTAESICFAHKIEYPNSVETRIELCIKEAFDDLKPEEVHNLCHDLEKTVSLEEFNQGCKNYQKKLFGKCATDNENLLKIIEECRGSRGTGDYFVNTYIYQLKKKLKENGYG